MIKTKQMAIPNRQIGWSNESNLLWNISSQLDRLTKVIANLSPGGGTNIYNSDGTLTGNRTLNGNYTDLSFLELGTLKFSNYPLDYGYYQDLATIKLGDYANNYISGLFFEIDGNNGIIKTAINNNDIGLKLDFANDRYDLGTSTSGNTYIRVDNTNSDILLLTNQNGINPLQILVKGSNNSIITRYQGQVNGLKLDFANSSYQFGQLTGGNTTYLTIDDAAAYPVQLTGTNISSGTAGAASGQFLKIKVGGVDYKIALLNP